MPMSYTHAMMPSKFPDKEFFSLCVWFAKQRFSKGTWPYSDAWLYRYKGVAVTP